MCVLEKLRDFRECTKKKNGEKREGTFSHSKALEEHVYKEPNMYKVFQPLTLILMRLFHL